ncbi:winged helix-turn-helix domain-containing protein [Streptomyces misionensis]|uniref:winged helix-turn-helix domain-containing protein n=1 Tax=Streptomyces misionensis TaxID=67331 RepID=UPI0036C17839
MDRLGFGPQVPARRVAERDEQAVTAWQEATCRSCWCGTGWTPMSPTSCAS